MVAYGYNQPTRASGWRKILYFNWPVFVATIVVMAIGLVMLYAAANGDTGEWAKPQAIRFAVGTVGMFIIAFTPITFWQYVSPVAYIGALLLLVYVEIAGQVGGGAQRWIDIGPLRLQPSEFMKVCLVMVLAAYYSAIPSERVSNPIYLIPPLVLVFIPVGLVLLQPDLGTALLLMMGGGAVIFLAGVSIWYFIAAISAGIGLVYAVLVSQGTSWQILKDYQYDRIEIFLDPSADPLGDGWNITQAKIALGSGGMTGRGLIEGSQSRLDFIPEKHTDFIFTSFAEAFGFIGSISMITLYAMITFVCLVMVWRIRDRFGSLLTAGLTTTFFLFYAINMAMVSGLIPVVGVPLPFVSYGGSAMLVLLGAFGLMQSAYIHRTKTI